MKVILAFIGFAPRVKRKKGMKAFVQWIVYKRIRTFYPRANELFVLQK